MKRKGDWPMCEERGWIYHNVNGFWSLDGSGVKIMHVLEPQGEPDIIVCDGKHYKPERTCQAKPAVGGGWFCSHCGVFVDRHPMANATDRLEARYCPNCGAMKE